MDLTLTPLEPEDAEGLHALVTRPDVADSLGSLPSTPLHVLRARLEGEDPAVFHQLKATVDGRFAGWAKLTIDPGPRRRHVGRIAMAVVPELHRHGIGSRLLAALIDASDRWLGLVRLHIDVWAENAGAIALYERHGFELEARRRGGDMRRGEKLDDSLVLARLAPSYVAVPAPPAPVLQQQRSAPGEVRIRPVRVDDAAALAALHRSEDVVRGTLQHPLVTTRTWRTRLETTDPRQHHMLVAEVGGQLAGITGLHGLPNVRLQHIAQVGLTVAPAYQGMGVGNRLVDAAVDLADRYLGVRRMELEVYADNERALKAYRRAGFVEEGVMRAYAFRDGRLSDVIVMARVR